MLTSARRPLDTLHPCPSLRSDIATAMTLGVDTAFAQSFFVLAMISVAHVQITFYWLVGSRADSTLVDLYRGFGDVLLDTPKIILEFIAIITGIISSNNAGLFIFALVLKTLSGLSHIYTLYKDISLFLQERTQARLAAVRRKFKRRLARRFASKPGLTGASGGGGVKLSPTAGVGVAEPAHSTPLPEQEDPDQPVNARVNPLAFATGAGAKAAKRRQQGARR